MIDSCGATDYTVAWNRIGAYGGLPIAQTSEKGGQIYIMKTSTLSGRLNEALAARGMKAAQLCRKCGISKSTMSQYLSGKYEPKHDRVLEMARVLGCSPSWLEGHDAPSGAEYGGDRLPVLAAALSAEELFSEANILRTQTAPENYCDGNHFYLIMNDRSMEPWLREGDRLLCVRRDTIGDGQLGVLLLDGQTTIIRTVKQSGDTMRMTAFNPYVPELVLSQAERGRVEVVGRVILSIRDWA